MLLKLRRSLYKRYFKVARAVLPVNIYLFNSPYGYHDNAKYLMEYFYRQGAKVYWVASREEARRSTLNINRNSLFLKLILPRVNVCFITHNRNDVCQPMPTAITVVNLWHGIALKKMGYDSSLDKTRLNLSANRNPYLANDFLIASSEASRPSMQSCMNLSPARVLALGQPRTDILFERGKERAFCDSIKPEAYRQHNKLFLYAPTFRDSGSSETIYRQVVDSFTANANAEDLLILRLHPEDKSMGQALVAGASNVCLSQVEDPIDELLMADALISDYSSIVFDYMILQRPIFLFVPDYVSYTADRSGFYFDFKEIMHGAVIYQQQLDSLMWQVVENSERTQYPAVDILHTQNASALLYEKFCRHE